jgi:nicotinamide mononucleotide transporter
VNGLAEEVLPLLLAMSSWEIAAVLLAISYLILATRENSLCWYCAFVSTAIYTTLFWNVNLLMDSALNVYYMAMAVYGWHQWRRGGELQTGVVIKTLAAHRHVQIIVAIAILTAISGYLLSTNTSAAWPFVDSFTTWSSVVTTVLVVKKILENWLYWLVIDAVSIPLYIERGLHLTALLFGAYLVIAAIGFVMWQRQYNRHAISGSHG